MDPVELARLAYTAYGDTTGGVNYQGNPMPSWDALPPQIQLAWQNAAGAIWLRVMGTTLGVREPPTTLLRECPHCHFIAPPHLATNRCPGCQQTYEG